MNGKKFEVPHCEAFSTSQIFATGSCFEIPLACVPPLRYTRCHFILITLSSLALYSYFHIGLAVNTGKTKYMEMGRHRGMIANAHIKIGSNSYEHLKTFKYLGSLLTNQNSIQEEIECRLFWPQHMAPWKIKIKN